MMMLTLTHPCCLLAVLQAGDYGGFVATRFFISWAGGFFVTTSLWTSTMFAHTVVGLAIATTAGWGNLGGGVTLAMHPVIFDVIDEPHDVCVRQYRKRRQFYRQCAYKVKMIGGGRDVAEGAAEDSDGEEAKEKVAALPKGVPLFRR